MGLAKRELERSDHLSAMAEEAAVKSGELYRCRHHPEILLRRGDTDAERRAYAVATNIAKAGRVDGTRPELMEAVKELVDNTEFECPVCTRTYGQP